MATSNPDMSRETIHLELGARSYDIQIGHGLLKEIGIELTRLRCAGKVGVVTDRNLAAHYLKPVTRVLKAAGYTVVPIVLPPGERTKTLRSIGTVMDVLVNARFERSSTLLALGGGVIGDITGFAAAIYQRGIPFVQVPTSLVAQVDSSVGGKTGVDHPKGKNLIGAFNQPRAVLVDPVTLRTLPEREWIAGLAEVIKYGVIEDASLFEYLEQHIAPILTLSDAPVAHIVKRSCEIKAQVVSEDEREADRRRILNFGHTIGHALESLGGYRGLIHGEAVAVGMVYEADLARHLGYCHQDVVTRLRALVAAAGLPVRVPNMPFRALWDAMQQDKKVSAGTVYCVVPERIGSVRIVPLLKEQTRAWYETIRRGHTRSRQLIPNKTQQR
ncbi:MAG: 3-dehydroquinate synthase [Nitrospira sp.]|nr:3-dehydroquinate synthase [Nitrospira sp.]ULA61088.1 MAG: 3-dehydroquinate synthase [Nitrospira sp.]